MNQEDVNSIQRALALFSVQDDGTQSLTGGVSGLLAPVLGDRAREDRKLQGVSLHAIKATTHNLWNVFAIALSVDHLLVDRDDGRLDQLTWSTLATRDISQLHTEVRSLMDHAAQLTSSISGKRIAHNSFQDLVNWVNKKANGARAVEYLGDELVRTIRAADWFDGIRTVRDGIVHGGWTTLAYLPERAGEFPFQVIGSRSQFAITGPPEVMVNENAASFPLYFGLIAARVLSWLDKLALAVISQRNISSSGGWTVHPGLPVVRTWLEQLYADGPDPMGA